MQGSPVVRLSIVFAILLLSALDASPVAAQVTREQRAALGELSKEMRDVATLVRRKKVDEAETALKTIEEKLNALGIPDTDRAVQTLRRLIATQKGLIERQRNGGKRVVKQVSFEEDVAPILKESCLQCHSNNPRGRLRLDTFAGMKAGGQTGPLVVVGNPAASLLINRIANPQANRRMPQNGQPLQLAQIQTIARWIAEGAKFDGEDENAEIGSSAGKPKREPVEIAMATGKETVSFSKDIAPFMSNLCVRCHSGNNARSGFSLENFEKLMEGGDSGRVVIAGNLDGSRLWDLVGKQDPIKMPPGQALITPTNWENLKTWIEEGARFDGDDPKTPLRELVPSDTEMRAKELEKLTPEEFAQHRMQKSEALWKKIAKDKRAQYVESEQFLVFGDVGQDRLIEISDWSEALGDRLRTMFNEKSGQLWKGRLTVFVVNDRFLYEEFNLVELQRETPAEVTGHAVVTAGFDEAYIVLHDIGEDGENDQPDMRMNLTEQLTTAFLMRDGGSLPTWLNRGFGLVLASQDRPDDDENSYLDGLVQDAALALRQVQNPAEIFQDGTFGPGEVSAIGYTLTGFILKNGGPAKFSRLIRSLKSGTDLQTSVRTVYQADLRALGTAYLAAMASTRTTR